MTYFYFLNRLEIFWIYSKNCFNCSRFRSAIVKCYNLEIMYFILRNVNFISEFRVLNNNDDVKGSNNFGYTVYSTEKWQLVCMYQLYKFLIKYMRKYLFSFVCIFNFWFIVEIRFFEIKVQFSLNSEDKLQSEKYLLRPNSKLYHYSVIFLIRLSEPYIFVSCIIWMWGFLSSYNMLHCFATAANKWKSINNGINKLIDIFLRSQMFPSPRQECQIRDNKLAVAYLRSSK